jgi:hypothetical protein
MPVPQNISKDHIMQAIGDIDKNSYDSKFESRDYVLCFQGKFYPPKYVVRLANKFANGRELESSGFISHKANRVLTKLGFTVARTSLTGLIQQQWLDDAKPALDWKELLGRTIQADEQLEKIGQGSPLGSDLCKILIPQYKFAK